MFACVFAGVLTPAVSCSIGVALSIVQGVKKASHRDHLTKKTLCPATATTAAS